MESLVSALAAVRWEPAIIGGLFTISVILAVAGFRVIILGRRDQVIERLDRIAARPIEAGERESRGGAVWARLARPFAWVARPTRSADLSVIRGKLTQAGFRATHAMELFFASKLLLATFVTLGFLHINGRIHKVSFPMDVAVAIWICGAGFLLPNMWLSSRIKKRQLFIERSLPDAMDLLVTCVEAGLGLDAALARVSEEMGLAAPLLASELQLTFLETQAGVPRREAFRRLAERTGVEDLRQLSAVLAQTEMFGTSVARALRVHADAMRTKRMQRAEEKAGMVGVKMTFPLIACILPSLVAVVLGPAIIAIYENIIKGGR